MTDNEKSRALMWLWLSSVIGTGKNRIWELISHLGSAENVCRKIIDGDSSVFSAEELKNASRTTKNQIESIISYCDKHNIGILCYTDENYPERLHRICNPPPQLFYRGNADILRDDIIVGIVGSRNPSDYSVRVCTETSAAAAAKGITVVSGFAVGTDIIAHLAAVKNGGRTIAVLGCGLDYSYPEQNLKYTDVLMQNGVFVSEYFPLVAAKPAHFLSRNRILAGLSVGVAVIEASQKSGSLNSASHAISQGRDLWVVPPHNIFDGRYEGNKILLRDGAAPIYSPYDIVEEYFENYSHKPLRENRTDYIRLDDIDDDTAPKSVKKIEALSNADDELPLLTMAYEPSLDGVQKEIYDIIKNSQLPLSADEISAFAEMDITETLSVITDLEIDGIVSSDTGQTYFII